MKTAEAKTSAEETLSLLGRRIDAVRARLEAGITHPFRGELAVWHILVDEVRVQAHLGGMEAQDLVAPLVKTLRTRIEYLKEALEDLGGQSPDEAMKDELQSQLAGLKAEIERAPEFA